MAVVLGIDAAWTTRYPSGVALVAGSGDGWRCVAVAPSYQAFHAQAAVTAAAVKDVPDPRTTLAAAAAMAGAEVDLVAVDMPLSCAPITGRREADRATSMAFGGRGCGTHSPNAVRPGVMGARLQRGFEQCGYVLATKASAAPVDKALLEVYPHPALLALLPSDYRVPYKVSRSRRYWPGATVPDRIQRLLAEFHRILAALSTRIQGISLLLPGADSVRSLAGLKAMEDQIDALVCAWVGIEHLDGRSEAFGDRDAAIWVPESARPARGRH